MEISLENLKAFITSVDEGSFSAAARVLGKVQSRVSTVIGNLKIDLGLSLFDRSGKYPVLTPEGKALLKEARYIVERCRSLKEHADIVAGGLEPCFRLAVDELIPPRILSGVLERFYSRFPDTELEILTGAITDISDMVLAGRADMGIEIPSGQPVASCEWHLAGQLGFIVAASSDHPLAKLDKVGEEDLGKYLQLLNVSRVGESDIDRYLQSS